MRIRKSKPSTEARLAEVWGYLRQGLSYRDIAALQGRSHTAVSKDVDTLRARWADEYGSRDSVFALSSMLLGHWLGQLNKDIEAAGPDERYPIVATAARVLEQLGRLHDAIPKPGSTQGLDDGDPSRPITVQLEVIPSGNRQLVDHSKDEPEFDVPMSPAVETAWRERTT